MSTAPITGATNTLDEAGWKFLQAKGIQRSDDLAVAVKGYLAAQHPGVINPRVDATDQAFVELVDQDEIEISQSNHFDRLDVSKAQFDGSGIFGILVDVDDKYFLVDGHHRTKYHREEGDSGPELYIILSQ